MPPTLGLENSFGLCYGLRMYGSFIHYSNLIDRELNVIGVKN